MVENEEIYDLWETKMKIHYSNTCFIMIIVPKTEIIESEKINTEQTEMIENSKCHYELSSKTKKLDTYFTKLLKMENVGWQLNDENDE